MAFTLVHSLSSTAPQEADGVIRALRHLNGLSVDGQELLVKCSAATQQYADEYLARKVATWTNFIIFSPGLDPNIRSLSGTTPLSIHLALPLPHALTMSLILLI
jgi:hypothetical protein